MKEMVCQPARNDRLLHVVATSCSQRFTLLDVKEDVKTSQIIIHWCSSNWILERFYVEPRKTWGSLWHYKEPKHSSRKPSAPMKVLCGKRKNCWLKQKLTFVEPIPTVWFVDEPIASSVLYGTTSSASGSELAPKNLFGSSWNN